MKMTSVKEKINAVRTVVTDRSNDEIVLVLQHHDEDIDKTISDFVEGRADHILTEWKHAGPVKSKNSAKKRKKKALKKAKQAQAAELAVDAANHKPEHLTNGTEDIPSEKNGTGEAHNAAATKSSTTAAAALKHMLMDSRAPSNYTAPLTTANHVSGLVTPPSVEQESQEKMPMVNGTEHHVDSAEVAIKQQHNLYHGGRRSRTSSETSTRSFNKKKYKQHPPSHLASQGNQADTNVQSSQVQIDHSANAQIHANKKSIEKAVKDLQRCSVSFGRYKTLLNDEIQDSYKRIKQTFEDLNTALIDREVELIRKLDEMKTEAFSLMEKRETQAHELKRQTDRAASMSHQQLNELRNEIKHFVAERKYDEELGRTSRFIFDREILTNVIPTIGEITAIKNSYSAHPRQRTESEMSTSSNPPMAPATAKVPQPVAPPSTPRANAKASSAASASVKPPPRQLPIVNPLKPATSSSGQSHSAKEGKSNAVSNGKANKESDISKDLALTTNGHVENWAEESSDLPLPESPASWASSTPMMTPDGTSKENSDLAFAKPQRSQRRDRNNKYSTSSDKDKDMMPPPQKIPQNKNDLTQPRPHQHYNNNNSNDSGAQAKTREFRGNTPRDRPRGGNRGFRGGYRGGMNRGGYRGPKGGEGDFNNPQKPFNDRSNDYGNRGRGARNFEGRPRGAGGYSKQPQHKFDNKQPSQAAYKDSKSSGDTTNAKARTNPSKSE